MVNSARELFTIYYLPFTIHQTAMYEHIKVEFDGGIVTITLNRPEKLNAFAGHMRRDLAEALERAGSDPEVRVVVLTGAGRALSTGARTARASTSCWLRTSVWRQSRRRSASRS